MDSVGLARLVIPGSWDQKKRVLANGLGLGLGDTLLTSNEVSSFIAINFARSRIMIDKSA